MLEFCEVRLEDRETIEKYLKMSNFRCSKYSFALQFIYRLSYNIRWCVFDNFVVFRAESGGKLYYLYPAGVGDLKAVIDEIVIDAKQNGKDFIISSMLKSELQRFKSIFADTFNITEDRDNSDYIYNANDLIMLEGKNYQKKRNHLKKFLKNGCQFEPITDENINECKTVFAKWLSEKDGDYSVEASVITQCLSYYKELGFLGGLIRGTDGVCAFTIGERLTDDTFVIHIEKALSQCEGSFAAINNCFAKYACTDYLYINREEDMGIEGLRKAKLSYYPAFILDEFRITEKKDK